jgi:hypothetical protein
MQGLAADYNDGTGARDYPPQPIQAGVAVRGLARRQIISQVYAGRHTCAFLNADDPRAAFESRQMGIDFTQKPASGSKQVSPTT